jgi:DNA polymerase-3 subunit delta'
VNGIATRGHAAALRAVTAMIRGRPPHAVLIVGPAGVGKMTLAVDLAAGLLCAADDVEARPCGACRACRLVRSGAHADVHRLGPEGPGRQVVIGGPGSKARGVRDLVRDLSLMPVEGGARIAIVESADRMNDDAQTALLKTLEEPPDGVTLILCADAEEPLLPTIRSRCARVRLGPVDVGAMTIVLDEHGVDDPALAARLTRIAHGRPGVALAWAADPDALRSRDELARTLLDLIEASPAVRLATMRGLTASGSSVGRPARGVAGATNLPASPDPEDGDGPDEPAGDVGSARGTTAERRRAAEAVIAVWIEVARDVVVARIGIPSAMHDPRLLEDVEGSASGPDAASMARFLDRLGRAQLLLASNVSPTLILDDLALRLPAGAAAAA